VSPTLPEPVAAFARQLAALRGTAAVVFGGSRATGTHRPDSDWDLGVYYRASERPLDPGGVRAVEATAAAVSAALGVAPLAAR
jgi:predicted nucleotidyltransferase